LWIREAGYPRRAIYAKEEADASSRRKNRIVIHAHTHRPYFEEVTAKYENWRQRARKGAVQLANYPFHIIANPKF